MTIKNLGYTTELENYRNQNGFKDFDVARVIAEHKERYIIKTAEKEFDAEILGNLRFTAQSRADFPAVGDWVAFTEFDDDKAIIHHILPRKSILQRQAVGAKGEKQIIATNIDFAFIVQAVDRDFSINRFERYLSICNAGKVKPIIILNKIDTIGNNELNKLIEAVKNRIKNIEIYSISNKSKEGINDLKSIIESGKTYCLLGSSGVGKSTLINSLSGKNLMKTEEISEYSNRGRHITTSRELKVLKNGGILIDNPGMREVGITNSSDGLEITFEQIYDLAKNCKFKDCTHTAENGCAVIAAVENGEINEDSYDNYLRMEREKEHYELSIAEKRKKDKDFGKIVKEFKNIEKSNKY